MRKTALGVIALALSGSALMMAQDKGKDGKGAPKGPPPPMSFFVTSVGKGDGANYGGLAGADQYCTTMAATAGGGGKTWHAYMSTQGPGAVNARDRIGTGPWYNAKGQAVAVNLSQLHGDTLEEARLGNSLTKATALSEKGDSLKGVGDTPNQHDILTGSTTDGRAYTDGMD